MKKETQWTMRYRRTPHGKAATERYEASAKGKSRNLRYKKSVAGRARKKRGRQAHRKLNREIIVAAKSVPCCDCGGVFPACCMDFHHITLPKSFNIGARGVLTSQKSLRAEIAKCAVICSNCHRIRHAKTTERGRRTVPNV